MESTELIPEYEQIRALLQVKAETMVGYLEVISCNQDRAPGFAYNLIQEVGDLAVGFYSERKRYQEVIKEYEIQKLNEMADKGFGPDKPYDGDVKVRPNAPIENDDLGTLDDYMNQPTISHDHPSLTSVNRADRLRFE